MANLETFSGRPSVKIHKRFLGAFLLIALIGFADASYLTALHYRGAAPACSLFEGCEKVTSSRYASVGPVPLALIGAGYYLALVISIVAYLDTGRRELMVFATGLSAGGFAASMVFVHLQLFVIRAICPYCMLSAVSSTLLFVLGLILVRRRTG